MQDSKSVPRVENGKKGRHSRHSGATITLKDFAEQARAQYLTVGEMVYDVLRQAIVNGVLEPGQHLRQDALAELIGVSRMPVRSALLQLESEGLVRFHAHKGAVVQELTPQQVGEIYEIRFLLESYALRGAIASLTARRMSRLKRLAAELDRTESGERFAELSFSFYRELYDADHHPLLISIIERLHSDVGRYLVTRRVVDKHEAGHVELLEHAERGDLDAAEAWLRKHLKRVADELIAIVAEKRKE